MTNKLDEAPSKQRLLGQVRELIRIRQSTKTQIAQLLLVISSLPSRALRLCVRSSSDVSLATAAAVSHSCPVQR